MPFICADIRWVQDPERKICIYLSQVAGKHLLNNNPEKWQVFVEYSAEKIHFSSQYFFRLAKITFPFQGCLVDQEVVAIVVIPQRQLVASFSASFGKAYARAPVAEDIRVLLEDVRQAVVVQNAYRFRVLPSSVVPEAKILFPENADGVDELLDLDPLGPFRPFVEGSIGS